MQTKGTHSTTRTRPPQLFGEDVKVGDALPEMVKKPDEVQLFLFSAVNWDTHRTHFDIPYSKEVEGLPNILVHGHLQGSFLAQFMTDWIGYGGNLLKFDYYTRRMSIPGDTLTCKGKVTSKEKRGDRHIVTCDLSIVKQDGVLSVDGNATVSLPSRS